MTAPRPLSGRSRSLRYSSEKMEGTGCLDIRRRRWKVPDLCKLKHASSSSSSTISKSQSKTTKSQSNAAESKSHQTHRCNIVSFQFHRCNISSGSETGSGTDSDNDTTMRCISCREEYLRRDTGTCKECYVEAGETEEELKREIEDLKAKVNFLRFPSSIDHGSSRSFTDVVLIASQDAAGAPPIPALKAILVPSQLKFSLQFQYLSN